MALSLICRISQNPCDSEKGERPTTRYEQFGYQVRAQWTFLLAFSSRANGEYTNSLCHAIRAGTPGPILEAYAWDLREDIDPKPTAMGG